eukprot:Transcript_28043.p1 GENE.Transcript_28043~~Transcript_28043.p1  ORF type:complete len:606 (+),score=179.04 Transcript_28043:124-1941(+)
MQLAAQRRPKLLEAVPGLLCCQLGGSVERLEGCEDRHVDALAPAMEQAKSMFVGARPVPMRDADAVRTNHALSVTLDRTQFAEQFEEMVLALEELTPHQAEKLKECQGHEGTHVHDAAGAGKTFVKEAMEELRLRRELERAEAAEAAKVAPTPPPPQQQLDSTLNSSVTKGEQLRRACVLGDVGTTMRLIADGADVKDINKDGYTPMHLAAIYGKVECVRLLLQNNANKEAPDNDCKTPLHWAAHEGKVECVTALLEAGAMKNASNKGGSRPLHFAAFNGELQCVRELLHKGADKEAADNDGQTPLHFAAYNGNVECVRALVEMSANMEASDETGGTPLHFSAFSGAVESVRLLMEMSANKEATDYDGETPLHRAAHSGKVGCVTALVGAGANMEATSIIGKTPLDLAQEEDHAAVVEVLTLQDSVAPVEVLTPRDNVTPAPAVSPGAPSPAVKNPPGQWDFFLSHTQRDDKALVLAELLFGELRQMGKTVWLDVRMPRCDRAAMEEGAKNSECFIAIVTDNGQDSYFSREYCRDEIAWAQAAGKTIVPVCALFDKPNIGTFIAEGQQYRIDFSSYNFIHVDRSAPSRIRATLEDILVQSARSDD